MDTNHLQAFIQKIKQWRAEGVPSPHIETRLKEQQLPDEHVHLILNEWKRIRTAKKRDLGFILTGIGGTIMLVSFLMSLFLFQQGQSFMMVLYIFTFIGIGIAFKGLIDILGW
jgi:hypothetical protein